jgi:hypothetical protein
MEKTQSIGEGLTFEQVWASIQATKDLMKDLIEENARQTKETDRRIEAVSRQMKETDKRIEAVARQMKETDKRLGKLGNRFGEMIEHMVMPNLLTKFKELGLTFTKANRTEIEDEDNGIFVEVDAFLENGDRVMAVEIKSKPDEDDIKYHVKRMEKLRQYADLHNDKRVYLGAIAGAVFHKNIKVFALKNGFYVIEPSGDTFNITKPEGEYYPHVW